MARKRLALDEHRARIMRNMMEAHNVCAAEILQNPALGRWFSAGLDWIAAFPGVQPAPVEPQKRPVGRPPSDPLLKWKWAIGGKLIHPSGGQVELHSVSPDKREVLATLPGALPLEQWPPYKDLATREAESATYVARANRAADAVLGKVK